MRQIYLDYNATTPLDPAVRAAMLPFLGEEFGNPSSIHQLGRRTRAALDDARERTAQVLRCKPSEIVFTSGGTESCNLAILGSARALRDKGRHIITSAVEHPAVLQTCQYLERREGFELTLLPVDEAGRVDVASLTHALRPSTILVSIQAANNEVGTLQPVAEIGRLCRDRGVLFHTDAVQWFGKQPFDRIDQFNADLVSLCGHKFHGPKGAGLLYIRSPLAIDPILFGGGHENERRAGTENLPAIAGLTGAICRFLQPPVFDTARLVPLRQTLAVGLQALPGVSVVGHPSEHLRNTVAFVVEGCDSLSLLAGLDLLGVCASSGSACSSGSLEPSPVLKAMRVPDALASAFVRFSLGRETTAEEVSEVLELLPGVIRRIRNCG